MAVPGPSVKGIVEDHPGLELLHVVAEHPRKAHRDGKKAGGLRREAAGRVESAQRLEGQAVEGLEAARAGLRVAVAEAQPSIGGASAIRS